MSTRNNKKNCYLFIDSKLLTHAIFSPNRFHSKEDNGLCLQVDADNDLSLDRCRGYYREQFDRVTARSSYPSSDALYPSMDTGSCVTYAGSSPQMRRSIVTTNGCSTQWIHFQPPPPDLNDCRETKFRLRGTNLCAGAVGRYVFQDDGNIELMSCGRDETRFCLLKSGQVQALEAFAEGTRNGYFEAHEDVNLLLQNGHVIPRQIIKFRTNGKIKSGIGQCLTTDSHWNPREGDRVMSKRCRVGLKWDVVGADDADNDDDPKYTICKFKLKKSGSLCAGNVDNDELHLMSCDDDDTRMKWGRNGLIQSTAGGDTYWESCSGSRRGSPPSNCQVILQNRADNGEQEFVLSGSDLILKGNTDACVTYEGNYPNAGDRLYLEDCDDVTNTRWVAKCDD